MIEKEPRYVIVALYGQTATLYDYGIGRELKSIDVTYADESEVRELYQECMLLNAKHEEDLLYLKNIEEFKNEQPNCK